MAYKLVFTKQKETFTVIVEDKLVYYKDRKINCRLIPRDEQINKMVIMSRNKIPHDVINWFNLNSEEQKEYESCNSDEEVAEFCINDAVKKSHAKLEKKEKI